MKRPSRPLSAERSCLVGGSDLPPISLPPRLPPILHGGQTQKGNVVAAIWHLSHSEYIGYTGLRAERSGYKVCDQCAMYSRSRVGSGLSKLYVLKPYEIIRIRIVI